MDKNENKSKLNTIQFICFGFNWIVGFGFIVALSKTVSLGVWSLLAFAISAFVAFATMSVFARATQNYPNVEGGSYGYTKLAFGKRMAFFQGWNQISHIFLLSATAPLFLAELLQLLDNTPEHQIYYQIGSVILFISVTLITVFSLRVSKKFIFIFGAIKYVIILIGTILVIYYCIANNDFANNMHPTESINLSMFAGKTMIFIYAFNGFNNLAYLSKDTVGITKFKKIMMIIYSLVFSFYLLTFVLFLGINDAQHIKGYEGLFYKAFAATGLIIFIIGSAFNRFSSQLSYTILYSRIIAPMAEDGYFPAIFKQKNRYGEYSKAIYLSLALTIISMIFFSVLPIILGLGDFFEKMLEAGTIVYLVNYLGAFIALCHLHFKKKMIKIPWWELILYFLGMATIIIVILFTFIPPIVNQPWTINNTLMLSSYCGAMMLGYLYWFGFNLYKKTKAKKAITINLVEEIKISATKNGS